MAYNRYSLTNEQRQQQVQDLTQKLEDGVKSVFESENYASYLKVMSQFTHYSVRNTVLIAMQTGGQATMVAGYEAWQKKFGRQVNKGEKAIKIFAPMTYQRKKEVDVIDQRTGQPVRNEDGSIKKEEVEVKVPTFRIANVFDISQTSGPPLPQIVADLDGNVDRFADFMTAVRHISPVPIAFEEMEGKDGYYHQVEKRIAINDSMSQTQTMAAVIHEVAHAKLHALDPNNLKESAKARGKDQRTMEVEAESISAVVSSYFGIDTSANSWGYVASWSKNKELPELTASLQIIKDTAGEIIDGMVAELEELSFAYMDRTDALEASVQGEQIYIKNEEGVFAEVTAEDITALPDNVWCRIPKDKLAAYEQVRSEMDLHTGLHSMKETSLLYEPENQFGIYQINSDGPGRQYLFLNRSFMQEYGLEVQHGDYELKYVAPLTEEDTLDTIYEKFNLSRPEDFEGHSLSVSDVIVMNKDGEVKAFFVDQFGFMEVPEFLESVYERPEEMKEAAFMIEDRFLEIHQTEGGYDYSIYGPDFKLLDGGLYESDRDLITVVKDIVQDLREPYFNAETQTYERHEVQGEISGGSRIMRVPYDELEAKTQEANRIEPEVEIIQGKAAPMPEQYKPLAKVEEVEEQNYNMVDNTLNNGFGEKERREMVRQKAQEYQKETGATIMFYAAECDEFPDMGEVFKDLPLAETAAHYQEILDDPRRSYMGNAMGFVLHDPTVPDYMDASYPLVWGKAVHGEALDDIAAFASHPLVQEAVEQLREQFPDYKYIPSAEVKQSLYPQQMTADEIANALIEIANNFELYEYAYIEANPEEAFDQVKYDLLSGEGTSEFVSFLKTVKEEDPKLSARAEVLIERVKAFEPAPDLVMDPVVKFTFSQEQKLPLEKYMPLAEADELFRKLDADQVIFNKSNEAEARMYIVEVSVLYKLDDYVGVWNETIFLGNGKGGVIDSMKDQVDLHLGSQDYLDYKKAQDPEEYPYLLEALHEQQEHVLPYLQQFCSLEERAPEHGNEKSEQAAVDTGAKTAVAAAAVTAKAPAAAQKKSIHERLKENKEKKSESPDKMIPKRGVELS